MAESPKKASRSRARTRLLGAIVFGAALPLAAGVWQTYGADTQEVDALLAPTTDFSKIEQGEDKPGGGATSRGSVASNAFSLSSGK